MEIKLSQDEKDEHNRLKLNLNAAIAYKDPDPESGERTKRIDHADRMLENFQNGLLAKARTRIKWMFAPSSRER